MSVVIKQVRFDFDNNWLYIEEQLYPEMSGCPRVVKSRDSYLSEVFLPCPVTTP